MLTYICKDKLYIFVPDVQFGKTQLKYHAIVKYLIISFPSITTFYIFFEKCRNN